jgi:hypothetical protein
MAGVECGKIDITKLPEDEIISINNRLWFKADVDEKIYIWNGIPCAVVKFSDAPQTTICPDSKDVMRPLVFLGSALKATNQSSQSNNNINVQDGNQQKAKTYCIGEGELEKLRKAQQRLDTHSNNHFGFQPAAIMPSIAVIPMKSNIKLYGPYASSNFSSSAGGTNVMVETDIAPWVFGSISAMNTVRNWQCDHTGITRFG